jgi:hypothetical protein
MCHSIITVKAGCLRRLFSTNTFFFQARSTTPLKFFYGRFRVLARSRPFPDLHCIQICWHSNMSNDLRINLKRFNARYITKNIKLNEGGDRMLIYVVQFTCCMRLGFTMPPMHGVHFPVDITLSTSCRSVMNAGTLGLLITVCNSIVWLVHVGLAYFVTWFTSLQYRHLGNIA